jgi:hemolysin III
MQAATAQGGRARRATRQYTLGEEIANGVIHGLGVALSVVALVLLIVSAVGTGDPWRLASAIVYGTCLVLEYTASTLYHSLPQPRAKHIFKILDHAGIYLLIAGSYTPFLLVTLRDDGGWWMFALIWAIAAAGIAVEAFWTYRLKWVSVVVYLAMGWLVVFAIKPLVAALAPEGVWLLVAGGLLYSLGTIFYMLKRVRYMHAVWHVFVLGGSVCHFLAVFLFVIPTA